MTNNKGNMLDRHLWMNALLNLTFVFGLNVASFIILIKLM